MNGGPLGRASVPLATYRLQLHRDFPLARATALLPYLKALGITHVYCSPYLKARAGSRHGYDIVDHAARNPEITSPDEFRAFTEALAAHGMGHILDMVPNHMAIGHDNPWWQDVLENGRASPYSTVFDIDWHPAKEELHGKVLLPVLEDQYGVVLENGLLTLAFQESDGNLSVEYHEQRFPLDPRSYPLPLALALDTLEEAFGRAAPRVRAYRSLITAFGQLPPRHASEGSRRQSQAILKQRLAALCRSDPDIGAHVRDALERYQGHPGERASFDALHDLLEQQAYRLAFWQVAADEINYRRFFDVNALAALRMENPDVFAATHRLVLDDIAAGRLQGLRIDHPDGLYDPLAYYRMLRAALQDRGVDAQAFYLVVEKILASDERLRADWPVQGTTGYDFANAVNGLYVWAAGERAFTRVYERFIGHKRDFAELLYQSKKLIIRSTLTSELATLARWIDHISERDRRTRDFTLQELRAALVEIVACFPVYRTYIRPDGCREEDREVVLRALAAAKRRSLAVNLSIFDFLKDALLFTDIDPEDPRRPLMREFAMRFQQYTPPVMAKGLEDTSFYIDNRLLSLNEVGGDPRHYGTDREAFHARERVYREHHPHTLLAGSTHDSKRSEDVRARLNVLSEIPSEWRAHLTRWARLNRAHKPRVDGEGAPDRNDEYLLYQTLLGVWPLTPHEAPSEAFADRIEAFLIKALREAKRRSSWLNPDGGYEQATIRFVRALLGPRGQAFRSDFVPFAGRVARFGLYNSLSQCLIRCTAPGVPDIYQGNELWDFSLVDPDNRRPVDYERRARMLEDLTRDFSEDPARPHGAQAQTLLETLTDGRAKLYLIWRALNARRAYRDIVQEGDYVPLAARGARAEHLVAFMRQGPAGALITIAPRWFWRLTDGADVHPIAAVWQDTAIDAPAGTYRNLLTGELLTSRDRDGTAGLRVEAALQAFPVALLARA